jgi:predicted Zn-dependent protease
MRSTVVLIGLCALASAQQPARTPASPIVSILSEELDRNFQALKKVDPAPYFVSYEVTEQEAEIVAATQGALVNQSRNQGRVIDVTVRVGNYELDNYHQAQGVRPPSGVAGLIPIEDKPAAIRRRIWLETDRAYKNAAQRLIQVKTAQQTQNRPEDQSADFSKEEPVVDSQLPPKLVFPAAEWAGRVRKLSAIFSKYPQVLNSNVTVIAQRETKTIVNTEGSKLEHGRLYSRVMITARGKSSDGMDLLTTRSFEATDPAKLPKDAEIQKAITEAAEELTKLVRAEPVDPFVGPAILSGRAAGVFFHEIFGHRIEGHRQKDENEGQTFTKSVNGKVLPDFLSVRFDATQKMAGSTELFGWYAYDDEAVKARPITLVDKGTLKTFLMSRSPIAGFANSNGHGRRQPGAEVVSRQSNLIVESANQVSEAKLRELLKAEIKKQNKPYGLYFAEVTGGFTTTGRRGLQAFTVMPLVVYRVYPDERPDEIIRGADIVGTPLASFAKIIATSNQPEVFNGYCGAESGQVPVSAVSPAILVSEIEIQRKPKSSDSPPVLSRPSMTGGAQ